MLTLPVLLVKNILEVLLSIVILFRFIECGSTKDRLNDKIFRVTKNTVGFSFRHIYIGIKIIIVCKNDSNVHKFFFSQLL